MSDYFETVSKLEAIKLDKKRITLIKVANGGEQGKETGE